MKIETTQAAVDLFGILCGLSGLGMGFVWGVMRERQTSQAPSKHHAPALTATPPLQASATRQAVQLLECSQAPAQSAAPFTTQSWPTWLTA